MKRQPGRTQRLVAYLLLAMALSGAASGTGAQADAARIKPAAYSAARHCDAYNRYFAHYYAGYMGRECFYEQRAHSARYYTDLH